MAEQGHLKSTYEAIMGLPPDQFELKPMSDQKPTSGATGPRSGKEVSGGPMSDQKATGEAAGPSSGKEVSDGVASSGSSVSAPPTFLAVPKAVIED
jgi:hypothetical protein